MQPLFCRVFSIENNFNKKRTRATVYNYVALDDICQYHVYTSNCLTVDLFDLTQNTVQT